MCFVNEFIINILNDFNFVHSDGTVRFRTWVGAFSFCQKVRKNCSNKEKRLVAITTVKQDWLSPVYSGEINAKTVFKALP